MAIFSQTDITILGKALKQRLIDQDVSERVLMYFKTSKNMNGSMDHVQVICDEIY